MYPNRVSLHAYQSLHAYGLNRDSVTSLHAHGLNRDSVTLTMITHKSTSSWRHKCCRKQIIRYFESVSIRTVQTAKSVCKSMLAAEPC